MTEITLRGPPEQVDFPIADPLDRKQSWLPTHCASTIYILDAEQDSKEQNLRKNFMFCISHVHITTRTCAFVCAVDV